MRIGPHLAANHAVCWRLEESERVTMGKNNSGGARAPKVGTAPSACKFAAAISLPPPLPKRLVELTLDVYAH
jgi:hypothetical protein